MMAEMSVAGVTSKAGLNTGELSGAVRCPATRRTYTPSRSSMGIASPDGTEGSMVEKGAAM